jgi:hypothetical protein
MCGIGPYDVEITELQKYKSRVYVVYVFIWGKMEVYVVFAAKIYTWCLVM